MLPFTASIDVSKLITVEDVMANFHLGPNGAIVYCMEFLEKNLDWLFVEVEKFKDHYFIFDLPGQVSQQIQLNCFERKINISCWS